MAQRPLPQRVSATQNTAKETDGTKGRGQGCWFCLKTALNEPSQIMCSAGLNLRLVFKLWCRGCYLVRKNYLAGSELGPCSSASMTMPSWKCSIMLFLDIQHLLSRQNLANPAPSRSLQVARELQPSVVWIGDTEKTFYRKVPHAEKMVSASPWD